MKEDILLFGGTFDPPHYGHLKLAEQVKNAYGFKKVVFIPVGDPPHKKNNIVSSVQHRVNMLKLAIGDSFEISLIETKRNGYTYTIDTLRELSKIYEEKYNFFYLIGADTLEKLVTWKDYKEVLKICKFIVVLRPCYNKDVIERLVERIKYKYSAMIEIVETENIDISSTDIRERVSNNESIKDLLPQNVEEYIYVNNLYKEREKKDEL